MMRLDKILSHEGFGTRKEVKALLKSGAVNVNGHVEKSPKVHIDIERDSVCVYEEVINYNPKIYLLMNKPQGVVSATEDMQETTVLDLVDAKFMKQGVFPVGRLDKDTTGLLLLTNDGDLAHRLLSPKHHVDKEYEVTLQFSLTDEMKKRLEVGVMLDDGYVTKAAKVLQTDKKFIIHLVIREGKYHQVKRMMEAVGNKVVALHRVRMGQLSLDNDLDAGYVRKLTLDEIVNIDEIE